MVIIVIIFQYSSTIQLLILVEFNMLYTIFIGASRLVTYKDLYFLMMLNESVVYWFTIFFVVFTDYMQDPSGRYDYGWACIYLILSSVVINLFLNLKRPTFIMYIKSRIAFIKSKKALKLFAKTHFPEIFRILQKT